MIEDNFLSILEQVFYAAVSFHGVSWPTPAETLGASLKALFCFILEAGSGIKVDTGVVMPPLWE